jgi:hypothetical protein
MDDIRLQTGGRRVTTRTVRPVVRRGVGLGGWMNMENFITGFPSTETLQRAVLDRAPARRARGDSSTASSTCSSATPTGVGAHELVVLADSFRFDACLKRDRLLAVGRAAAADDTLSATR